jgi:hypothetical protein
LEPTIFFNPRLISGLLATCEFDHFAPMLHIKRIRENIQINSFEPDFQNH